MEPLYIVYSATSKWRSTTGFNLLIYADRLVALPGLALKGEIAEAKIDRRVLGRATSVEEAVARIRRREDERIADALAAGEDEAAAVPADLIAAARLRKRAGIVTLTYSLADGERAKWMWMSRYGPLDEVEPVLREVLGERLA